MKFTHDGNKTHVNGLVNFEKMHMLAQTMRTLRYCRARHLGKINVKAHCCRMRFVKPRGQQKRFGYFIIELFRNILTVQIFLVGFPIKILIVRPERHWGTHGTFIIVHCNHNIIVLFYIWPSTGFFGSNVTGRLYFFVYWQCEYWYQLRSLFCSAVNYVCTRTFIYR